MPPIATPAAIFTPVNPSAPANDPRQIYAPAPSDLPALTITGAATAGVNGRVIYAGLLRGKPAWSTNGTQEAAADNVIVEHTGTAWKVSLGSAYSATKTSSESSPVGLTSWTVGTGSGSPGIAAAAPSAPPSIHTI